MNTKQSNDKASTPLQELGQTVEDLLRSGRKMMTVMNRQTEAIISAREEELEKYTEEYTDLRGSYDSREQQFIAQLCHLLGGDHETLPEIRLGQLKRIFPDASRRIDQWRDQIREQSRLLKRKNEQVAGLLEFALNRNAELMYSIYNLNNRRNTRYGSAGQKEELSPGIAINKEA